MGIDYSGLKFPKGAIRVEAKREKRLDGDAEERACRAEVWRRYGRKCNIPGCKEAAVHQHHLVYKSRSRALKYDPSNRVPLCRVHHELQHAGKIALSRDAGGTLIVKGESKYVRFKA